jgi:hypothetical protein
MIEKGKDMITIFCNSLLKRDHLVSTNNEDLLHLYQRT